MTKKLNIRQLAAIVAADTTRPVDVTEEILWQTFEVLAQRLASGEGFGISNFGSFETRKRSAHVARNLQTGEGMSVPEHSVVHFKATGRLRAMVRDGDTSGTIRKSYNRS